MKITAKRIKKRWIAGGIVIVAAAVGIALFVKAKGSKDTVNAGSGQQSTVQLSKQDLVESISATGTFESATNKSVTSTATNLTVKKVLVAVGDTVQKGDSLVNLIKAIWKMLMQMQKTTYPTRQPVRMLR